MASADTADGNFSVKKMQHLGRLDIPGAMAIAFSSTKPEAYVSTRGNDEAALVILDITDPRAPGVIARLPLKDVGQEDLNLAERPDGTAFVLLGPPGPPGEDQNGLTIVDVSNVKNKGAKVLGGIGLGSHTWTCLGKECYFAYGIAGEGDDVKTFAVVDIRDPRNPKHVASPPSLVSSETLPHGYTHDWNSDEAGVMWAVGREGIAAYEVKDPKNPKPLNTSDANGGHRYSEYNDWLHLHGSLRPNAPAFHAGKHEPSVNVGNVLLVTEEGNDQDCSDSFQTWHIPHLDPTKLSDPVLPNSGTITPLDTWSLLQDTTPGIDRPLDPDFCSVHWFDYHQDGFVAMAAYGAGTRILDVMDASRIAQVGYHYTARDMANHSYWVPERDKAGRATGRATSLIYTADVGSSYLTGVGHIAVAGGIDIFQADLPSRGNV